jgi:hypothetical protein
VRVPSSSKFFRIVEPIQIVPFYPLSAILSYLSVTVSSIVDPVGSGHFLRIRN